jgi:hypothetical protein
MQSPAAATANQKGHKKTADRGTLTVVPWVILCGRVTIEEPTRGTSRLKTDFTMNVIMTRPITNKTTEYNGFL